MVDRQILRFPSPTASTRTKPASRFAPTPKGFDKDKQQQRFQPIFERLVVAFDNPNPDFILKQDPTGIAPERALVFETAGRIQDFTRVAKSIGLEVITEIDMEIFEDLPEDFELGKAGTSLNCKLYTTMPTLNSFRKIISLWNSYQRGEQLARGDAPWKSLFNLLLDLRPWGPQDRLTEGARAVIEERLEIANGNNVTIEFEIWPTVSSVQRTEWRNQTEKRINETDGKILDSSSISDGGFTYEAVLADIPSNSVRNMLDNPDDLEGLVTLDGVQFILPQMIGQAGPNDHEGMDYTSNAIGNFNENALYRAVLFDGTPTAGHHLLDGGVKIEDIHSLVRFSVVEQRYHATAMASLILRGDIETDGHALEDTRLVSVPLLIDNEHGTSSPNNRLFIDLLHSTLTQLFTASDALGPDVFVANFAVGIRDMMFSGRISSLARLIDWWAAKEGVLFVISAGNINNVSLEKEVLAEDFKNADVSGQIRIVWNGIRASIFNRTLLAPAESLNGLTVGGLSTDLVNSTPPLDTSIFNFSNNLDPLPQFTNAIGLGPNRAIKPDFLNVGGQLEFRLQKDSEGLFLSPLSVVSRTGLIAAAPHSGQRTTQRSRGTSTATALTTRAILQAAEALTGQGGPYEGQELPRRELALITRALAVNSSRWPENALNLYNDELSLIGRSKHERAKEEVCRYYGFGVIAPDLMRQSPDNGVTFVGLGSIKKDGAQIFNMPLPPSMSGEKVRRSMRVTIAWFTPVNPARAQYRLAGLEAEVRDKYSNNRDDGWGLKMAPEILANNTVKRGSVWSRRLVNRTLTVPEYDEKYTIPICVHCRDTSSGGLHSDVDIDFAIVVTLEIESIVQFDIYNEVKNAIQISLRKS